MIRPVCLVCGVFTVLAVSAPTFAQHPSGRTERGWIDLNLGAAVSAMTAQTFSFAYTVDEETFAGAATYPKPPLGVSFDVGGGYMFTPQVGLGLSFTGTAHEEIVGLGLTLPHPFFFNSSTTAGGQTDTKLQRFAGAANIQFMAASNLREKLRVRFFAGPTWLLYRGDLVSDIRFSQVALPSSPTNVVAITGFNAVRAEGSGWGVHVGSDVAYFFSRVVGLGGFARYTRGHVTLDREPLSETQQRIEVGGFQVGGGLRLRF